MKLDEIGFIDSALPPKATTFWGKPAGETQFFFILLFTLVISCGLQGIRTQRFG